VGPEDSAAQLKQALDLLAGAAAGLVQAHPLDPRAYHLNRLASWLPVLGLPPAEAERTSMPAPAREDRLALERLAQAGRWLELLPLAEWLTHQHRFWLLPSRLAAQGLEALGLPGPARGLGRDCLDYLERLPGLDTLAFQDGTPFVDPETRAWLAGLAQPAPGAGAGPSTRPDAGEDLTARFQPARAEAQAGRWAEALALLVEGERHAPSQRERLSWRLEACRQLARNRQTAVLNEQVRQVLGMLDGHGVRDWEPDLAADALETLLACLRAGEKRDPALWAEVFARLARLAPGRALGLG
jgi:type VI secretion system protein VasJ